MRAFPLPPRAARRRRRAALISAAVTAVSVAVAFLVPAPATADTPPAPCRAVSIPATLADGTDARIAGTLCAPAQAHNILVLLPGITYTSSYWDFPYQPDRYSFVQAATRNGYATLALDKLGTGGSTRPASTEVALPNHIATVHQVIQALRRGDLGRAFTTVTLIGHSYGSVIASATLGRYPHDADALVTSGYAHTPDLLTTLTQVLLPGHPAMLDPRLGATIHDPGYVTTSPGQRRIFYNLRLTDPAVVALDEDTKDVYSLSDVLTYLPQYLLPTARAYNGPVLAINGQQDEIMCGNAPLGADCGSGATLAASERPYYGPDSDLTGVVIPGSGHDLALHTNAPDTTRVILDWLHAALAHPDAVTGRGGDRP